MVGVDLSASPDLIMQALDGPGTQLPLDARLHWSLLPAGSRVWQWCGNVIFGMEPVADLPLKALVELVRCGVPGLGSADHLIHFGVCGLLNRLLARDSVLI